MVPDQTLKNRHQLRPGSQIKHEKMEIAYCFQLGLIDITTTTARVSVIFRNSEYATYLRVKRFERRLCCSISCLSYL